MPEKGFTATFVSNTGRYVRRYDVSGWKLVLLRLVIAAVVLVITAAVIVTAFGLLNAGERHRLAEEIAGLRDSLTLQQGLEMRMELLEQKLKLLDEYETKMEHVASVISPGEDSTDGATDEEPR